MDKVEEDRGFDLFCAVLDRVVVSDVFPDEIVKDILDDLIEQTAGGVDGGGSGSRKPGGKIDLSSLLVGGQVAVADSEQELEPAEGATKVSTD
jgi:hypothetical protein